MEHVTFLTLDKKGAAASVAVGVLLLLFGWGLEDWAFFLFVEMLLFLVLSGLITVMGRAKKKREGNYERKRGTKNVVANALAPLIFAFAFLIGTSLHINSLPVVALVGYIGSVGGIAADKFSSEIGVLDGRPRMIIGLKKVKKGISGGITWLGLVAGLVGAAIMALVPMLCYLLGGAGFFGGISYRSTMLFGSLPGIEAMVMVCLAAGFIGTVMDSLLGYVETKNKGSKHLTNFLSSLIAGLIAILIVVIVIA